MSRVLDLIASLTGNAATKDATAQNTPASTDNTKKLATTEWCFLGFEISKGVHGYIKLPDWMGGLIIQWGSTAPITSGLNATVTFPRISECLFPSNRNGGFSGQHRHASHLHVRQHHEHRNGCVWLRHRRSRFVDRHRPLAPEIPQEE